MTPRLASGLVALLLGSGCLTGMHVVRVSDPPAPGVPFVTAGPSPSPCTSLGVVQVLRSGPLFAGFVDPAGTNLEWGMAELQRVAAERGADGVIRVTFRQTDYPWWGRVAMAVFFFLPMPTEVVVRGELVRLDTPRAPVLPTVTSLDGVAAPLVSLE